MNKYNLIFKGNQGNVSIIENNSTHKLLPNKKFSITSSIKLYYTIQQISSSPESLIIQSNNRYYSIIFNPTILIQNNNHFYYFLYLNNLLNNSSSYEENIYGANIIEQSDIDRVTIQTSTPQIFSTISRTVTVTKKPINQTSSYVSINDNAILTLLKNERTIFASCSFINGSNFISFCGSYESHMEKFLLYNNDLFIDKNSILEYKDLCDPVNLNINFSNSV